MANTYKNIVITPNRDTAANVVPVIRFSGGDASTNTDINVRVYTSQSGTLSFEGSAGQLFSITNDLTNSIFSVNDVSGIPSIDVYANGNIFMAPYSGNVVIGRTTDSTVGSRVRLDIAGAANASNILVNGNMVFTAANDGSGSNLDADLLDGQQGTYYGIATDVTAANRVANAAFLHANAAFATVNSAFGVANAALPSSSYTASDVLSKLLTVDGAGSNLDADLLDGVSWGNVNTPINVSSGTSQPLQLTTSSSGPWHIALTRSDLGTSSKVFYHNSPYVGWYFEHNISIAGSTNWHSGNDGTGSGLDADTVDGLDVHTARNNEANKIVRTDANGYLQAGWINTPSGDNGTTALTKVYASSDDYIRTYTPANFRTVLDVPTRTGGSASGTWSINVTGSAGSATTATNSTQLGGVAAANFVQGDGARGRSVSRTGGTANSLTDPSGFYFGNSVTGMPTTDWWTWNQSIGNSWVSPDGYGWQHAVSFWSDDIRIRRLQSGAWQPWTVMLHSGNYNSYAPTLTGTGASGTWGISITGSAGSATTATTATNSTQLGGVAASSYMRTDSGQTVSARHTFTSSQTATLQNASGSLGGLEVYSAGASAAAFMSFHRPGAYASYFGIDTDNNFAVGGWSAGSALGLMKVGSFGVGTAASGTAGEIRATNNITAYYSDKRLKTNIKQIENALDKVNRISGVTFNSNEEAAKYGYTDTKTQVGVIAQEIEAVLPEVVVPAPFDIEKDEDGIEYSKSGQNYKTVQYEKLVPLLIEAIKELSSQVEELKKRVGS